MIIKIPESFGQAAADIEHYLEWRRSPEGRRSYWLYYNDPIGFHKQYEIYKWRRILMEAPCKDCKDRQLGCHSKCKEYKAFAKRQEKLRQERFEKGQRLSDYYARK